MALTGGRRLFLKSLALAGGMLLSGRLPGAFAQDIRFLTIGVGRSSSTSFMVGGLLATTLSNPPGAPACEKSGLCGVPGVIANVRSTAGALECLRMLETGGLDLAIVHAQPAIASYTKMHDLREVAPLYSEALHLVVRDDGPIRSFSDLAGKTVSVGDEGAGLSTLASVLLKGVKAVKRERLSAGQSVDALRAGKIDAAFLFSATPSPLIFHSPTDDAEKVNLTVISLPEAAMDAALKQMPSPAFEKITLSQEIYKTDHALNTLETRSLLLTTIRQSSDFIETLCEALWQPVHLAYYVKEFPQPGAFSPPTGEEAHGPIPLHEGVKAYYARMSEAQKQIQPVRLKDRNNGKKQRISF